MQIPSCTSTRTLTAGSRLYQRIVRRTPPHPVHGITLKDSSVMANPRICRTLLTLCLPPYHVHIRAPYDSSTVHRGQQWVERFFPDMRECCAVVSPGRRGDGEQEGDDIHSARHGAPLYPCIHYALADSARSYACRMQVWCPCDGRGRLSARGRT